MTQPTALELTLRSSIFHRPRKLTIHPDYLEMVDNNAVSAPSTRFQKEEIEALRYGLKPIRGYDFIIGRIYCIDIRSTSGKIIKIRLKSIYRVRRRQLETKYQQIRSALFQYYFHDITRKHIRTFQKGQPFELIGVSIDAEGVLFDENVGRISWDFLGLKRYWNYYSLFSLIDPGQYKAFEFADDWNAGVLFGLISYILKTKFPDRKS